MRDLVAQVREVPDLAGELARLVRKIPVGRVAAYGDLARALGSPLAARWVAAWTLRHAHESGCPCHRVVRTQGEPGGFIAGTPADKLELLRREGVPVAGDRVEMPHARFTAFGGEPGPLERLREMQEAIAARVSLAPLGKMPREVGGVDVSYPSADEGVATYALVDVAKAALLWSVSVRLPVRFPYITTFLSFREIPFLLDVLAQAREAGRWAPVVLVDGSGVLHPAHVGIASHLGVLAELATIGVTKTHLAGTVNLEGMAPRERRAVVLEGDTVGVAIRPTAGSRRPIFVSPGHRMDVAFAQRIVEHLLVGHRLPEPLYWADRLSRAEGRKKRG